MKSNPRAVHKPFINSVLNFGNLGLYKLVKMLLANIIKLSVKDLIRTSFFFI